MRHVLHFLAPARYFSPGPLPDFDVWRRERWAEGAGPGYLLGKFRVLRGTLQFLLHIKMISSDGFAYS